VGNISIIEEVRLCSILGKKILTRDVPHDNDPYGEHDFGSIKWHERKTFWKIDYYDQALQYWHDPLSPECRRVLTVMLAEEY